MKKLFAAIAVCALTVACALTMTACAPTKQVKIIEIGLSNEQYGVAVKKGDVELKSKIDEVLTALTGDGVDINGKKVTFQSIYDAEIAATENEEWISIGAVKTKSTNRANEFVVVTNADFAPFEYMVGNSYGGIDMQIAKIIADQLNKELVVLHVAFESVATTLTNNDADAALAGFTINSDRLITMDFSIPYYNTTQYIAVAEDFDAFNDCKTEDDVVTVLSSLTGAKAGAATAQTGYFYLHGNESFEFDGFKNINTTAYPSIALAVKDLANGKIQLVCGDKDTLTAAVSEVNK